VLVPSDQWKTGVGCLDFAAACKGGFPDFEDFGGAECAEVV